MSANELLLIDLSSIGHMMWHTCANEPDPNASSTMTLARVRALASEFPHAAICLDTPPYLRSELDPTYKANRNKDNNAAVSHQIAVAADALRADGFPVWGVKGYEADDIIASAVNGTGVMACLVVSADKDLLQLVSERVKVKSLKDGSIIDADAVEAKFGVRPEQVVDYLSLVGDTSDNIAGAKGIGAKTASTLLQNFGTLDDLCAAVDAGTTTLTPKLVESLQLFRLRLDTVRNLIRLRTDAPIPFNEILKLRVPVNGHGFSEVPDEREPLLQASGPAPARPAEAAAVPAGGPSPEPERDRPAEPSVVRDVPAVGHTALVVADAAPVEWERQLEPRNMGEAKQIAMDLFQSRLFSNYGNAPAVLSTVLAGRELGFQTMASLRAFHLIEGKPTLSAGAMHALVITSGKAEYFECSERTPERATFVTKRKGGSGREMSLSFTIEDGRQAWNGKRDADGTPDARAWAASGWGRNPADMLVARALVKLARLVYPDITHGLYSPEELS